MKKIKEWYHNLESVEKGILFINIIWVLMFISAFLIFDSAANAFENDLQYKEIGLELIQNLRSNFAFVWAIGFALIGFIDFCIASNWMYNKIKKPVIG